MTPTPYQPYEPELTAGIHGGYSEQRLAENRFLVRFHGNELTTRDRVEGYMLYRAAELTVQSGYDWFAIVDRQTEHEVQTYVHPDPFYRPWYGGQYGYWRPYWRYYRPGYGWNDWYPWRGDPFWASQIDVTTVESFEAVAEIVVGKGPMSTSEGHPFNARQVMSDLGPSIVLPHQKQK
ncbi:hypothetical protein LZ536_11300 [Sphingomonas sp. SE158]|uniref:DUF4136 domain-containing protein n=2 Tax=Sphingomonas alba TaxID=2908208 RepID=A0ABT0RQB7_9SPHN|nr:hypothetical protein [Sphingomonas alba]MCL6684479.1 hypothetical protein [Sphingomonas alba]